MTEQTAGPRCGNNPNFKMSDGDRKAVDDFKARLALQAAAKPYIERAVWVDFDPLMEVIAATIWEHCARDDEDMPQLVRDDPRTIAAFAAAVARAHAAAVPTHATDRAALREQVVQALYDARRPGLGGMTEAEAVAHMADAVLAALPTPADQASALNTPVRQRADCTELEWAVQERARFERLYTRESVRADLAEQRADTAARDADIYQQRLERLSEGYTEQRKRAEEAERIRENADFHLGQEMARRQLAEKETAQLRAVVARLRQMTDHWEQQLPDVIRTPAVVSAIRAALEAADDPSRLADETQQPEAHPLAPMFEGLHHLLATSSRDWSVYRVDAWLWAVLCGWDCEQAEHDDTCTHGALEETAAMHGWDAATLAKARRYRAAVRALTEPAAVQQPKEAGL